MNCIHLREVGKRKFPQECGKRGKMQGRRKEENKFKCKIKRKGDDLNREKGNLINCRKEQNERGRGNKRKKKGHCNFPKQGRRKKKTHRKGGGETCDMKEGGKREVKNLRRERGRRSKFNVIEGRKKKINCHQRKKKLVITLG